MAPELPLAGRVAVVLADDPALGDAIAARLAGDGARVVRAVASAGAAKPDADRSDAEGVSTNVAFFDSMSEASTDGLVRAVVRDHGSIDIWVNAPAVVGEREAAETMPLDRWTGAVDRLLTGVFLTSRAAARPMLAKGRGVIVNVGTVDAHAATPGHAAVSVAMAGLAALTRALGVEWADRGVRVAGVAGPSVVMGAEPRLRTAPVPRPATPADIADTVAYLASDAASYVTAETLPVDGGWRAYHLF